MKNQKLLLARGMAACHTLSLARTLNIALSLALTLSLVFSLTFALVGCSTGDADKPGETSTAAQEGTERVVIMGEITETVGNMITLNLIERTQMTQMTEEEMAAMRDRFAANAEGGDTSGQDRIITRGNYSQDGNGDGAMQMRPFTTGEGGLPEGFAEAFPDGLPEGFAERFAEGFPEGFTGQLPEGFTGELPEGIVGMTPARGRNYTGETKEIIIPAGAPVLESSYSDGTQVESEINLDKLKVGDVIEVTYASDGQTVAKVVKQSTTQNIVRFRTDASGEDGGFQGVMPGGDGYASPIIGIPLPPG